jgi:hypothetical protein
MLARNLTVDFNKKGEVGPGINALYMFANASIQGTVRTASALSTSGCGARPTALVADGRARCALQHPGRRRR